MDKEGLSNYKPINVRQSKDWVDDKISKELVSNPEKYQTKLLVANKGVIGETNKRLSDNFNEGSYSYAYGDKQSLKGEIESALTWNEDAKIGVKVVSSSSLNSDGHPIEQITIYDKTTGVNIKTISATRGDAGISDFLSNASSLSNSRDPLMQEKGMKMFVNSKIMPALISSGINGGTQTEGVISNWTVKDKNGENKPLGWVKEVGGSGSEIIRITVGGNPTLNQFFSEQEVANALYKILPK